MALWSRRAWWSRTVGMLRVPGGTATSQEDASVQREPPDREVVIPAGEAVERPPEDTERAARRRDPWGHEAVPRGVQVTAAWAWRLLVIAAAAYVGIQIIARMDLVVVPLLIALLLSALLQPAAGWLVRHGARPGLAAAVAMIGGITVIGLLVWLVVREFRQGYDELADQVEGGIDKIRDWLVTGPLGLSEEQIDSAIDSAQQSLEDNRNTLTTGALGVATTLGHVITGALLVAFSTFFFVKDGRRIWTWTVRLFPRDLRPRIDGAGGRAWTTLISYVRATIAVAFVDAVGIGIAVAVLGVPLALPLAVLVFLGAFIPIIGATLSGMVAVLVALVANGPLTALLVLAAVILVQQLEGHVLQPVLLGRAVRVHPLAVVVAIAAGVLLAGIVGALVAVPIVAVANTVAAYLSRGERTVTPTEPAPP